MITSGRDLCGWLSSPQPKRPNWRAQTYFFWFSLSFPENAGALRLRHRSESGETAAQPQPPQAMSRCSHRLILFSFPVSFRRNFVSSLSTHADPIHISWNFVIAVRRCEERAKRKTEDAGRRGDVCGSMRACSFGGSGGGCISVWSLGSGLILVEYMISFYF